MLIGLLDMWMDGWMDGSMDRWTDGWTDGQRRADRLIEDGKTDTSDGQRTKETNMET